MHTYKRIAALLLVLCLALSLTCMSASATAADSTEELEELEKLAANYVTSYIENIYLDGGNDLTKGTISELAADTAVDAALSLPLEQQVQVGQEITTLSQLCGNITFLDETAQYYGYLHTAQDIQVLDFTLTTTILEREVEGDSGFVHLYALAEYRYPDSEITSAAGDHYIVKFWKTAVGWTIVDMTVEFLEAYGVKQESFDLQASIQSADEAFRAPVAEALPEPAEPQAITSGYSYNKHNAVAYSMVYTTSRDNYGEHNYPEFRNTIFQYFDDPGSEEVGRNCQNYVSQCLWFGLGGSNTSSALGNSNPPMDSVGGDGYKWYWKKEGSYTGTWTAADAFLRYANNSFDSNASGQTGMRGRVKDVPSGSNFSNITANDLYGSVLEIYDGADSEPSHAVIIAEASGLDRADVKFNGNSPMRKHKQLSSEFPSAHLSLIIPSRMDVIGSCTHSYTNSGNWSGAICNSCGYNRMRISSTIPDSGVYANGTTVTFSGSAGFTCYRMAMGITTPSGSTSWTERTNTSSISRSYTFSQTGLYTIRISARNMPDTASYPQSTAITYVFTVRVY